MLADRERRVLIGGGAAALAILVATLLVAPAARKIRTNERALARVEDDVRALQALAPRIAALQVKTASLARRFPGAAGTTRQESPLALLSVAVQSAGIPQSSFSLASGGARDGERFREERFDLKIENRPYLDVLKVVSALSEGKYPVIVRSVGVKGRYEENGNLDAVIRVGYLSPK